LVLPLTSLPSLERGKGNKLINISSSKVIQREEFAVAVTTLAKDGKLSLQAGKRTMTLSGADLTYYIGERGRRGHKLPKGFQKVAAMTAE